MTSTSRNRSRTLLRAIPVLSVLTLGGCASNTAPPGWLDPPERALVSPYGGWVQVQVHEAASAGSADGELVAVAADSLHLLRGTEFVSVARSDIRTVRLTGYRSDAHKILGWAVLGSLGSLSHGVIAIFSIPVWILGGTGATIGATHAPEIIYGGNATAGLPRRHIRAGQLLPGESPPAAEPGGATWAKLGLYARFPEGLPPGLDRRALAPKPVPPSLTGPARRGRSERKGDANGSSPP